MDAHRPDVRYGLTLSSEEHPPRRLVEIAAMADEAGFDFVSISDHYHPWIDAQGHSPFVWSVLGAIAERTTDLDVAVGVTCPIMRIHPAVLAQATATTAHLLGGRFTWGVGTGEALNEHILADRWVPAPERLAMLEEAVDIIRELWTGDQITYQGTYYEVENAQIYDPPPVEPPVIVSAFGPRAASVAARVGDGLWVTGTDGATVGRWRDEGGIGPVYSQITLSWADDRDAAIDLAHRMWPNTGLPGQLAQDLPTPAHVEQAAQLVTRDVIADSIPCGADADAVAASVEHAVDAGVDHVYLHQIGDDQEGFCAAWRDEIAPRLGWEPARRQPDRAPA